ncbi:MAG TPA: hypothetical protein GX747_03380 [Tenericutes bacterium]|nr:hypothetical protein [Mycoplasmatota bacterium]
MEEKEWYLTIWVSYSEQANELTNKRFTIDSFYIAALSALITANVLTLDNKFAVLVSLLGFILSIIWLLMIISFKKLSTARFLVIAELEKQMDIKPYEIEWKNLKKREKNKYINLTTLEKITSAVFIFSFLILLIYSIINVFN